MKFSIFPLLLLSLSTMTAVPGCKKFVDVGAPATSLSADNVFADNTTAANVVTAIYANMVDNDALPVSYATYLGVYADELSFFGDDNLNYTAWFRNAVIMTRTQAAAMPFWSGPYNFVYRANAAIEGLQASKTLTDTVRTRLLGEAYFLRGFLYFYLVNVFGDVPLVTGTDYRVNQIMARSPVDSVYKQVIADLLHAQELLGDRYVGADGALVTAERVRPNKSAATAMLARAYLYNHQYDKATESAGSVISNAGVYALDSLGGAFLKQSREAIWQLQPVVGGYVTPTAGKFVLPATGPTEVFPFYLSHFLLDSFYTNDLRLQKWVGSTTVGGNTYYYPYKYRKIGYDPDIKSPEQMPEYEVVIRLAEMYLIRAEARLLGNHDASGCAEDLNVIRHRAGLPDYAGPMEADALAREVLRQRQVELFSEWGHRWFDIKRMGKATEVMSTVTPAKGGVWSPYKELLPLPITDIITNANLKQNVGY